jgi:tetratricopeptide (TPR) repeat protein
MHVESLARTGRVKEADAGYDALLKSHPENVNILASAINFHYRQSRLIRKALILAEKLVALRPKNADFQVLAAEVLLKAQNRKRALVHAKIAAERAPHALNVLVINAAVYIAEGLFDEAQPFVEKALKKAPRDISVKYQHAQILMFEGKSTEALQVVQEILAKAPEAIEALGIYVGAQTLTPEDPVLIRMRDEMLPAFEKCADPRTPQLLRLLGNAHNDIGAYDAAFDYHRRAKAKARPSYDAKAYASFVNTLCDDVSRADFTARGASSETPVLVVGMPRTGSTLLEQVLAGHPLISSVGESLSLRRIVNETGVPTHNGSMMVKAIKEMPHDAAVRLAERYLAETSRPDATRVIDKSLHNFELLGFFAGMLPKARIIHLVRDPMDTCVSCYMQTLPSSHRYTESLEALGHAYAQYRHLMDHWAMVLPNPMLTLSYEEIVSDLEGSARRAVAFLGLEWDDACLDYQRAENKVKTISAQQVRQPLYRTSLQRWRRYEAHVDPLKEALAPFYPRGFEPAD